jgi:hypothetical protein
MQAAIGLGASSKVGVSLQAASALAHRGQQGSQAEAHTYHQARLSSVSDH